MQLFAIFSDEAPVTMKKVAKKKAIEAMIKEFERDFRMLSFSILI
jgi:hypothetical protein